MSFQGLSHHLRLIFYVFLQYEIMNECNSYHSLKALLNTDKIKLFYIILMTCTYVKTSEAEILVFVFHEIRYYIVLSNKTLHN